MFVYGSLKKGFHNHHVISSSRFVKESSIHGFKLFDLGYYPGIVKGSNTVCGELYIVNIETLVKLDLLESNGRLYKRIIVDSNCGNKDIGIFTYEFLGNSKNFTEINSGVY